jgi:ankyrin repeat protein
MRLVYLLLIALLALSGILAQDVEVDVGLGTEDSADIFPLLRFATMGDVVSVADEIRQGRNVNERLNTGLTAAHAAARYNHNKVLSVVSSNFFGAVLFESC